MQARDLTRRNRNRADAALKRRDAFLQHGIGRIRKARIHMPGALHVEKRRGVVRILKNEGRGLIDWRGPRARRRVGFGARMKRKRVEFKHKQNLNKQTRQSRMGSSLRVVVNLRAVAV